MWAAMVTGLSSPSPLLWKGLDEVPQSISVNTRYLNLQENSIQVIKSDTFKHLSHLEILQLSKNHIRQIEVGAFNGLPNLITLELFDNRLPLVPSQAFEYLSKLRELWLRNNPIETLPRVRVPPCPVPQATGPGRTAQAQLHL
ncbi:hypothetical protein MHYP_G00019190 [Metynnis hypsauchen]